ncbi:MAG: penicillin-binding protein 2 [Pseudomonadota bacterium]
MSLKLQDSSPQEDFRSRFAATGVLVAMIFALLLGRAWYLQIFNGRKWREFSEANRIEIKRLPAMRGRVLDRHGRIIADSRPSFDLTMTPAQVGKVAEDTIHRLIDLLSWKDVKPEEILDKLRAGNPNDPVVIKRDMSRDELALFLARQYAFRGVEVIDSPARSYPFGTHGSHLLGYLGEVSRQDLKSLEKEGEVGYRFGDVWGISGIEREYEGVLRGENGGIPIIVDAWGRKVGTEFSDALLPEFQPREPSPGTDLVLAIDGNTQEAAEAAFTHEAGAVVAIDPRNGDVIALVSRPEYAPDQFARGVSHRYWSVLTNDPKNPLYDRTLRGQYPPGSTFKMVTGTAALQEKVVSLDEKVFCPGHYRLGRETKKCWKQGGHGWVDFHKAVVQSCDVYFYEMGRRLGVDRIAKYARSYGFGEATGIGINREERGLVPTEAWKQKVYHQPWVGGETLSVAIGQGAMSVTPIQLAVAYAALSNAGKVMQPRIALEARELDGKTVEKYPPRVRHQFSLDPTNWRAILDGLGGVVNEPGGTAYFSGRSALFKIGGKTGTAQTVGKGASVNLGDHAWFVAFAPVDEPRIAVAVIVEHGGHGGTVSAPIARKVIETYLGGAK